MIDTGVSSIMPCGVLLRLFTLHKMILKDSEGRKND